MTSERKTLIFSVFVLSLAFLPFLILCLYNYPSSDDYLVFPLVRSNGVYHSVKMFYTSLTGRYSSLFLVCTFYMAAVKFGLYGLWYKAVIFLNLCFFAGSLTYLFSGVFKGSKGITPLILALSLILLFNCVSVNTSQYYYWLQGTVVYVLSNSWMFLFFGMLYFKTPGKINSAFLFILAVLICGSGETAIIQFNIIYFGTMLIRWTNGRRPDRQMIVLAAWIIIFTLAELLAPGNKNRSEIFLHLHAHDAGFAFTASLDFAWRMILAFIIHPATWLFSIFYLLITRFQPSFLSPLIFQRERPFIFTCFLYIPFFLTIFLVIFSLGGSVIEMRVMSSLTFLLVTIWIAQLELLRKKLLPLLSGIKSADPAIAALSVLLVLSAFIRPSSFSIAINDLTTGKAASYRESQLKRFILLEQPGDSTALPDFEVKPVSIFIHDISSNPQYFINVGVARTFRKKAVWVTEKTSPESAPAYPFNPNLVPAKHLKALTD